ncbi:hypothetical protein EDB83DRAFT_2556856, partial [Lactarius deliciosus]
MRGIGGPRFKSGEARSTTPRSGLMGLRRSVKVALGTERAARHVLEAESEQRITGVADERGLDEIVGNPPTDSDGQEHVGGRADCDGRTAEHYLHQGAYAAVLKIMTCTSGGYVVRRAGPCLLCRFCAPPRSAIRQGRRRRTLRRLSRSPSLCTTWKLTDSCTRSPSAPATPRRASTHCARRRPALQRLRRVRVAFARVPRAAD